MTCQYCQEYFSKWVCGEDRDTGECDCPICQGICECKVMPSFNEGDAKRDALGANAIQVGGSHYKEMGVEPWDVIDTWPIEQRIGAYRAGILKYVMRMGTKDESAQEIRKAAHYCQKLAEVLEAS